MGYILQFGEIAQKRVNYIRVFLVQCPCGFSCVCLQVCLFLISRCIHVCISFLSFFPQLCLSGHPGRTILVDWA